MPMFVIVEKKTGYVASQVVVNKGAHGYAIRCLRSEIELLGYRRTICK